MHQAGDPRKKDKDAHAEVDLECTIAIDIAYCRIYYYMISRQRQQRVGRSQMFKRTEDCPDSEDIAFRKRDLQDRNSENTSRAL